MRTFIATVLGVISAGLAIWLFEMIGHMIFPVKLKLDPGNQEALKTFMFNVPVKALIAVLVAHGLGLLIGLIIAQKIDTKSTISLYIISAFLLLGTVLNLIVIPHPMWFAVADTGIILIVTLLFIRSVSRA